MPTFNAFKRSTFGADGSLVLVTTDSCGDCGCAQSDHCHVCHSCAIEYVAHAGVQTCTAHVMATR